MHVLFDLGHPAHVHLFRNVAKSLIERGDRVTITTRDRGIIGRLLDHYNLPHTVASRPRTGLVGSAIELLIHNGHVLRASLPARPDFLVGTSVSVAHVGRLIGRPSIVLNEDDADYVPLFARITYPFASRIVIPSILRDPKTSRVRTHKSYHELAYLHPDHFTPDPRALAHLGVSTGEPFIIVRLVELTAHHDVGAKGLAIAQVERLVAALQPYGRVFVNGEGDLPASLREHAFRAPPEQMHSILAFAKMLVSDSQTMTMEAAVLGRPAIRCNTFVGKCSVITELEDRYQLAWGFQPSQFDVMLEAIRAMLADSGLEAAMAARRARMLTEKHNLADWLLDQFDRGFP
jgi:predicted glycosyltransferase